MLNSSFASSYGGYEFAPEGDGSSYRSSDDGTSASSPEDERQKYKLQMKIGQVKEKLLKIAQDCENDIEYFMKLSQEMEAQRGADNPQLTRLRQNFDRKNNKHKHEQEALNKKLAEYERRLDELNSGAAPEHNRSSAMTSIGTNIRRNLKGIISEHVIGVPLEMANKIKKHTFGSADDVRKNGDDSKLGQSMFYASSEHGSFRDKSKAKCATLPSNMRIEDANQSTSSIKEPQLECSINNSGVSTDVSMSLFSPPLSSSFSPAADESLTKEVKELRRKLAEVQKQMLADRTKAEQDMQDLSTALEEERFKTKRLEVQLNDTIELHQSEFQALKQEQKNIANRLDYQYNERFSKVEEAVEGVQNHCVRMEASLRDTIDVRFAPSTWTTNTALLSLVNLLVEFIKIILFMVATALDFVRPFTGSRVKAGCVLFGVVTLLLLIRWDAGGSVARWFVRKNSSEL